MSTQSSGLPLRMMVENLEWFALSHRLLVGFIWTVALIMLWKTLTRRKENF